MIAGLDKDRFGNRRGKYPHYYPLITFDTGPGDLVNPEQYYRKWPSV